MTLRLSLALDALSLPTPLAQARVYNAGPERDLMALTARAPASSIQIIERHKPAFDALAAQGFDLRTSPEGLADLAVVFLPRSKQLGLAQIEEAARFAAHVIVDGAKTDGIDSIIKRLKKMVNFEVTVSKAHGKAICFEVTEALRAELAGWADPGPLSKIEGYTTRLGVFSVDRIDRASELLAEHLPDKLPGRIADFGAGWGYLSRAILQRPGVKSLDLIEADYAATLCARENIDDPRASVIWADATTYQAKSRYDIIVMNPPFHTTRAADPSLGQAFIRAAAKNLAPSGVLLLVANRQLPYEAVLAETFIHVDEITTQNGFKILRGAKPFTARR